MEQLELLGIHTEQHEEGEQYYIGMSRFIPYFRLHEDYVINNEVEIVFTNHLGNEFVVGLQKTQFESLVKQFNKQLQMCDIQGIETEIDEIEDETII